MSVRNVSKSFGQTRVLSDVSLDVGPRELMTLPGPSGCGKFALLCIIADLDHADEGSIALDEQIAAEFMKANPQCKITLLVPQPGYEEVAQATLRAAVTNSLPDGAHHGLNRQRIFFDRGLAQPLDALIAPMPASSPAAMHPACSTSAASAASSPASTPIIYYNGDLVAKAGGDPASPPSD